MTRIAPTLAALALATLSLPAWAESHMEAEVDAETVTRITEMLAAMNCQMDPDDIEVEEDGYELDDVICEGGAQYDIELDADLEEVGRRAE